MGTRAGMSVALAASVFITAACDGQNQMADLEYRVDDRPMDREQVPVVTSYAEMLSVVRPAVVSVFSRRVIEERGIFDHPLFQQFFGREEMQDIPAERELRGIGSGVIISPQGFVLTNNHVIDEAEQIAVRLESGREYDAEVVGRDPQSDVAVLRIEAEDLPTAILGDSDRVEVGDVVFALGNAFGIGHAVTTGIISARGRTEIGILGEGGFEDFIQTDAAMNIGNSGGPLVDAWGRVIGINTAIASPGGGSVGIGFAIPINLARHVVQNLIEHGEVLRGFLGIHMQPLTTELAEEFEVADPRGALIVNVLPESPADRAGVRTGDVIVAVDGEEVASPGEIRVRVGQMRPGAMLTLGIIRDAEPVDVEATLGSQEATLAEAPLEPEPAEPPQPGEELMEGVTVEPMTSALREELGIGEEVEGIAVTRVSPRSPYRDALAPGSVILQINREPVDAVEPAREALREGRNLLLVQHRGMLSYVVIDLG